MKRPQPGYLKHLIVHSSTVHNFIVCQKLPWHILRLGSFFLGRMGEISSGSRLLAQRPEFHPGQRPEFHPGMTRERSIVIAKERFLRLKQSPGTVLQIASVTSFLRKVPSFTWE